MYLTVARLASNGVAMTGCGAVFARKSKTVSVGFGDLNYGFVLPLAGEGIGNTGIDRHLKGSHEIQLGDGSPSGHHIVMSALDQRTVMILLGSKPRDIGGVILAYATPESPYWEKVVRVMNEGGSSSVVGIAGMARANPDGTVGIYVLTG